MNLNLMKSLACLFFFSLLMVSCDSINNMAKKHATDAQYEQTPNPMEMHGDKVKVNISGSFKPKFFNKKAGMIFEPQLQYEGGSLPLKPMWFKGDKVTDDAVLVSNANGGKFTYQTEVDYKPELEHAKLVVNPVAYPGKSAAGKLPKNNSEAQALKKAIQLGEKVMAEGMITTSSLIEASAAKPSFAADKYEKETIIPKKQTLFYQVDMSNLNLRLPFNKTDEFTKNQSEMEEALAGEMEIKSVKILAWASPEGEESRNDKLSQQRSQTGEKYLNDTYKKVIEKKAKALKVKSKELMKTLPITTEAKGEDWEGFLTALRQSDISEKNTIINVVTSQADKSAREQEIRNMTVIYQQIEENILPALRRAEILIDFKEIKKTDEEMALLSTTEPQKLTLEELLYAATLAKDEATQLSVYESATKIYPSDWRAFNNVAYLHVAKTDWEPAHTALQKANALHPTEATILNNLGVVTLNKKDLISAKSYFQNAQKAGSKEARLNLAILSITEGDYNGAMSTLGAEKGNLNLALAQIMSGNVPMAKQTLAAAKESPKTSYLRAVCAAREKDQAQVVANLKKTSPELKKRAAKDDEFKAFQQNTEFQEAVK